MSDPKRATLITVGATKCAKNNVNKTVRLTINLDESNESKYPELNYKELVIAEERKKREKVENGKTTGLDPFSENNDDVERIARKFEQKYGGKSTYGRKGRSKHDDFADIGAGYDENDSFIDNTHGYDEMIPPECDTLYGGFYINCGSLEFKNVPESQLAHSDGERVGNRNKRRISSSSSSEESSESSSESSQDEKETTDKPMANGHIDSHDTQHRKKKNKKADKQKAKKIRRTDSSAATSGKQTSDDNVQGEVESADSHSRTSQSDSLTSKPAPSSENEGTLDNFGDEVKLPPQVIQALEALESFAEKQLAESPNMSSKELKTKSSDYICRMSLALEACGSAESARRGAWARAARALRTSRAQLRLTHAYCADTHTHTQSSTSNAQPTNETSTAAISTTVTSAPTVVTSTTTTVTSSTTVATTTTHNKRKNEDSLDDFDPERLSFDEREAIIVDTLRRLKDLIEERKPAMIANYNAECERVQEARKKLASASGSGAPVAEKRLPKRRFPWCGRSRALVCRLARAAGSSDAAAALLQRRALPLFPQGFLRMPTLLRQADLSKEVKASDLKRQRLGSTSQPPTNPPSVPFTEPIQFPSSLTVTTTTAKPMDKPEPSLSTDDKYKQNPVFGSILNAFTLSKDLVIEKPEKKDTQEKKEEIYIPPNNIGNITITPVPPNPQKTEKKINNNLPLLTMPNEKQSGFIRVKSPAALNDMVKKDKNKKTDKHVKEKRVGSPLHIDTSYQPNKKDPSPKLKEEIPQKQIESMRTAENNIPRPALIPVHHSPTFAKPDKRPPEVKKKKDVLIISDVDPLSEQEPLAVDDSSSDVELIEDNRSDKSELKHNKSETVPSKDSVSADKKVNKCRKEKEVQKCESEEATKEDIDTLIKSLKEMANSQEPTKFNSNSYGGVITSAKYKKSSSQSSLRGPVFDSRDKDKFIERTSLNKMDGCSAVSGEESNS